MLFPGVGVGPGQPLEITPGLILDRIRQAILDDREGRDAGIVLGIDKAELV